MMGHQGQTSYYARLLCKVYDLRDIAEGKAYNGIGTSIIDGNASGLRIMQG